MTDDELKSKLEYVHKLLDRALELLESSYTSMMLEMGLRLMPQNGKEILYMKDGEQRVNIEATNGSGVSEVILKVASDNASKGCRKQCKYLDCGWCYAPKDVYNNSVAGACMKPKECVQNGG
jgi:hypothetical protein